MSQPSRADRRRANRGGSAPPPKRDPMMPVYIGLAVIIVLVFAGFGIARWSANRAHDSAVAFDTNTPTPGPNSSSKPIPIADLKALGTPMFPAPKKRGTPTDTVMGGQGEPVDGIPCQTAEGVVLHIHSHVALFVNGQQAQIPAYIGMVPVGPNAVCLYWIHTHDASGIIHVEAGDVSAPNGGSYTLGQFFDIWGQPLGGTQIGTFAGAVTAFVNGARYEGNLAAIPLRSHQEITLEVGTPVVAPPLYKFPVND